MAATADVGGLKGELRSSLLVALADFGDALLRGAALRGLLFLSILALELLLASTLKANLLASRRCLVIPENVVLGALPAFVPKDVAAELARPPRVEARSVRDPELEPALARAWSSHPWVRRVVEVRRVYPSRAVVTLELRAPFALVDVERWRLTVDAEGVVLEDRSSAAPTGLPIVRADAKVAPGVPPKGRPFRSEAVKGGLALLRDLRARAEHPFLRDRGPLVVDVTGAGAARGSDVVLELENGVLVEWGGPPGGPLAGIEASTTRKLDALLEASAAYPGFRGVTRINVMTSAPFVEGGE